MQHRTVVLDRIETHKQNPKIVLAFHLGAFYGYWLRQSQESLRAEKVEKRVSRHWRTGICKAGHWRGRAMQGESEGRSTCGYSLQILSWGWVEYLEGGTAQTIAEIADKELRAERWCQRIYSVGECWNKNK